MLTSPTEAPRRARPAYRNFRVAVSRVERLSPTFVNVTFTGDDLSDFGTAGLDQRVKVVLPLEANGFASFPDGEDWYTTWRELPGEQRNPFRTYTVRAVRPEQREVDVVFACHGDVGPASAWAGRAKAGDEIVLIGPDEFGSGRTLGIDWRPGEVDTLLLAGDETATPAICAILESLPADATGAAFLEVPESGDRLDVRAPAGVEVRWLARAVPGAAHAAPGSAHADHGSLLAPAVRDWVVRHLADLGVSRAGTDESAAALAAAERDDLPDTPLWDVPAGHSLDGACYAWLAGEASVITGLRRFLVREAGLDRRQVAFMGYWRRGRAELE
ncbi:siderophore-interacting protein [Agromyces allii]|uniref:FAD-binding FR-type domain-containing protein n=1 Tax=Agromyces allii TaxID=393607 RepID=A0ABN2Q551_9MICO|nr:siderophore-interacting protein [Agromyces allii]